MPKLLRGLSTGGISSQVLVSGFYASTVCRRAVPLKPPTYMRKTEMWRWGSSKPFIRMTDRQTDDGQLKYLLLIIYFHDSVSYCLCTCSLCLLQIHGLQRWWLWGCYAEFNMQHTYFKETRRLTVKTLWSDAKKLFLQIFTVKSILRILMNKDGGL